jgi:hypothetical protein
MGIKVLDHAYHASYEVAFPVVGSLARLACLERFVYLPEAQRRRRAFRFRWVLDSLGDFSCVAKGTRSVVARPRETKQQ